MLVLPSYVPYLILVLISLMLLAAIMLHQRQLGVIFVFMTLSGIVYAAEFFVLILFDGYAYFPRILSIRYYDNAFGAVVSNLMILPALGLLSSLYRLQLGGIAALAGAMVGVEYLFDQLHIFEQHWWNLSYTGAVLVFFFFLARFWVGRLYAGGVFYRFTSLWMQAWSGAGTVMYGLSVLGLRHYHLGVFEDIYRDDLFLASIMGVLKSGVFSVFVTCCSRLGWRMLAPLAVFALDMPIYAAGWLEILIPFWQYALVYMLLATLLIMWSSLAHRYLWNLPVKSRNDVDTTPSGVLQ
ncbi:hypothetical protein [Paenibacillus sp. HB172176]|uniref:hypothetical protein n=1 Tax=Paenibacillus sp. HB172176 TaxID=2493690 RepID=UPI00143A53A7|nr:hypothetical protein [Paenibacillus sp. HB172176]